MTIYKNSIDDVTKRLIYFFLRKNGSFRYSKQEQLTNENPLNNEKYKYNSFYGVKFEWGASEGKVKTDLKLMQNFISKHSINIWIDFLYENLVSNSVQKMWEAKNLRSQRG